MKKITPEANDPEASLFNRISFIFLFLFFILFPLHAYVSQFFPYYREAFAAAFAGFFFLNLFRPRKLTNISKFIAVIVALWVLYIVINYFIDPGVLIYDTDITKASDFLNVVSPRDYVLRNLMLYLPMFFLLISRGISKGELEPLLTIIVIESPISIYLLFSESNLHSLNEVISWFMFGAGRTTYNNMPPFISLVFISGIYLFVSRIPKLINIFILIAVVIEGIYIVISTSRQSVLFCVFALIIYLLLSKKLHRWLILIVPLFLLGIILINWLDPVYKDVLYNRYLTPEIMETSRWEIMSIGLQKLRYLDEWLFGRGLSSVVYSGPHNNYLRFIQRIGIIGMLLTYVPFYIAFTRSISVARSYFIDKVKNMDIKMLWYLMMALLFTIWHSFFSYPHEESLSAPLVWFGLALWIIFEPIWIEKKITFEDKKTRVSPLVHHFWKSYYR